jgi:hypothetical protein
VIGAASTGADGRLRVEVEEKPDETPPPVQTRELEQEYRAVVEEILELRGDDGRISAFVRSISEPGALADTAGYSPDLNFTQKLELLETLDIVDRLKVAVRLQQERLAELQVRKRIREDVESGAQKQQRDYFLRQQMDAIRKELGESDGSVAQEYRKKIEAAGMPDHVRQQAERELSRYERIGDSNAEASMIRTYLDWLLAVPWAQKSEERLDPRHAREVLDADHAGLDDAPGEAAAPAVQRRTADVCAHADPARFRAEQGRRQRPGDRQGDRPHAVLVHAAGVAQPAAVRAAPRRLRRRARRDRPRSAEDRVHREARARRGDCTGGRPPRDDADHADSADPRRRAGRPAGRDQATTGRDQAAAG